MRSSSLAIGFTLLVALAGRAWAQQQPQGFGVERLSLSAPGGGWFAMDDLDMHGGLGGAMELTLGFARNPLRINDGANRLAVVSRQAFADVGGAIIYERWRFYLSFEAPIVIAGQSGTAGNYSFTAPTLDWGGNPDPMSDARIGTDVRILGEPGNAFRFGAGAQLYVPFGNRADYHSDGTYRGMVRALVAGDAPYFTYAAQLGVHIRPLDQSPVPESPKGTEAIFGFAAGAKLPASGTRSWALVVGPEIYGATAFRLFLDSSATALEGLLTGRFEGTLNGVPARIKLGAGGGLNHHFGASEWRMVAAFEIFGSSRAPAPALAVEGAP